MQEGSHQLESTASVTPQSSIFTEKVNPVKAYYVEIKALWHRNSHF